MRNLNIRFPYWGWNRSKMTIMSPRTSLKSYFPFGNINSMNRTSMQTYLHKFLKYMDIGYKPTGLCNALDDGIWKFKNWTVTIMEKWGFLDRQPGYRIYNQKCLTCYYYRKIVQGSEMPHARHKLNRIPNIKWWKKRSKLEKILKQFRYFEVSLKFLKIFSITGLGFIILQTI